MEAVRETLIPGAKLLHRGKVRDIYDLGQTLAIVATDRISCFDVILPTGVPDKGRILTQISRFWFNFVRDVTEHHLLSTTLASMPAALADAGAILKGRVMIVRKCDVFPVECIVRGWLAGSAVTEYQATGRVSGVPLPAGLVPYGRLPQPIFTPSTKAEQGAKDQNITFEDMERRVGSGWAQEIRTRSLQIFNRASRYAHERGLVLADTKFEWGLHRGRLMLVDEALTPDSSRFWAKDGFVEGQKAESFDKQYVRDWLTSSGWNKEPPAPELPADVVARTRELYLEALKRLTGETLHG